MKKYRTCLLAATTALLAACAPEEERAATDPPSFQSQATLAGALSDARLDQANIKTGQTIYVPVYSHIRYLAGKNTFYLASTLSIRNTDPDHAIVLTSVRYYDSQGQLIGTYLDKPAQLAPLGTAEHIIQANDKSGGTGANYIVEWIAEHAVSEPLVETVMVGSQGNQGIAFSSRGRVIRNRAQ